MEGPDITPYGISSTWPVKAMRKHYKTHAPGAGGPWGAAGGGVVASLLCFCMSLASHVLEIPY
eukprot:8101745-Heterocapsa_arctica.AAC.1